MSVNVDDARNVLIDERLSELRELKDQRDELLREMFAMVRLAGRSRDEGDEFTLFGTEDLEDDDKEGLERFLERFDLEKNPQTGSIMTLEFEELYSDSVTGSEQRESQDEMITSLEPETDEVEVDEVGEDAEAEAEAEDEADEAYGGAEEGKRDETEMDLEVAEDEVVDEGDRTNYDAKSEGLGDLDDETILDDETMDVDQGQEEQDGNEEDFADTGEVVEEEVSDIKSRHSVSQEKETQSVSPEGQEKSTVAASRAESLSVDKNGEASNHTDDQDDQDAMDISFNTPSPTTRVIDEPIPSKSPSAERAESEIRKQETPGEEVIPPSPSLGSRQDSLNSIITYKSATPPRQESRIQKPSTTIDLNDKTPLPPPRQPPPPIIVQLSVPQQIQPSYSFSSEPEDVDVKPIEPKIEPGTETTAMDNPPQERITPSQYFPPFFKLETPYTLPPLSALPPEFNRKGKPQKRKKDREREKSGSDNGKRDDWSPLGMTRWQALLHLNPAYKKLARATKCVLTRDWTVGTMELRLIRAFERIEALKQEEKWSFRQYKKTRVAAGLVKTHWDYLMDEMKWLQVDFREERRWKIALAYELAHSVCEWHAAGSREERIQLGICQPWRRPDPIEAQVEDMDMDSHIDLQSLQQENDELLNEDSTNMLHVPSDDEDDTEDQQAVDNVLSHNENQTVDESTFRSMEDIVIPSAPDVSEAPSFAMKLEEIENNDALHIPESQIVPDSGTDASQSQMKAEIVDPSKALVEASSNPTLNTAPLDLEALPGDPDKHWDTEAAKSLRNEILNEASGESLFLNFSDVVSHVSKENPSVLMPEDMNAGFGLDISLSQIFPELQLYGMTDITSLENLFNSNDGKKKGDKKSDKDDPTKRVEETTYTKLCPTNRFMYQKPTLISALEPARKWKKGRWVDLDESPVVSDGDGPPTPAGVDNLCSLFEGKRAAPLYQPPIVLQSTRNNRPPHTPVIPWSGAEENLLKSLAEQYPSNWRLVADALNSSRIRTSADLRTPFDCYDKYREINPTASRHMHGPIPGSSHSAVAQEQASAAINTDTPQTPVTPTASQMMTRGVKKMASNAAQNSFNLTVNTNAHTVESRKRRRHFIVNESMRKTSVKREKMIRNDKEQLKKQSAVPVPAHDTHLQIGSKARLSPIDLVQKKAEIDKRIELERQNLWRRVPPGMPIPQNIPQIRQQVGISQLQQLRNTTQSRELTPSPQMIQQPAAQARALAQQVQAAQAAQAQVQGQQAAAVVAAAQQQQQQQQQQPANHVQLQNQLSNQVGMNGQIGQQMAAQFAAAAAAAGANTPSTQHSSPPNSSAAPATAANFARPPSSQQRPGGVQIPGTQVLPLGSVPIARTNTTALSAYLNNNGTTLTPEQVNMFRMLQHRQEMQMQMHNNAQQNQLAQGHQAGVTGFPAQSANQQ